MGTSHGTYSVGVLISALSASTVLRAGLARRRYRASVVQPGPIDVLVTPPDGAAPETPPIELLALGDSGMAGVGVTRRIDALPCQVALRVAAVTRRPVHVVSHARAGARTRDVLVHQVGVDAGTPDVVLLLVGTNDVMHLTPRHRLATDTTNVLAALARMGAPVVMSSLPELGVMRALPGVLRVALGSRAWTVRKLQTAAVRDARGDIALVDVRGLVGREFTRDRTLMSGDRFHPSSVGYALIAEALAPVAVAAVPRLDSFVPEGADATGRAA